MSVNWCLIITRIVVQKCVMIKIHVDVWFNLINIEIDGIFWKCFWITDFIYVPNEFLFYTYFKNWMIRFLAEKIWFFLNDKNCFKSLKINYLQVQGNCVKYKQTWTLHYPKIHSLYLHLYLCIVSKYNAGCSFKRVSILCVLISLPCRYKIWYGLHIEWSKT